MSFYKNIFRLMERTITQRELAKVLGVNRSNLSELLNGKKRFGKNKSARLEEITGIRLRTWLFGKPEEIRQELEKVYGRINFKRGRLSKNEEKR